MADDKKEKIYGAVLELFKEGKNIKNIKVSEIAERAGIGKGSIYLHFACKDDVIVGAVKYFLNTWLTPFRQYAVNKEKPFKDIIMEYVDIHLEWLNEYTKFFNPEGGQDYINVFNSNTLPGTIEVFQNAKLEYMDIFENILKVGVEKNEISYVNRYSVNMAAQSIFLILKYLSFKEMLDTEREYTVEECKEAVYDMILRVCR